MPSNIIVNFDYDKTEILDLFNNSEKTGIPNLSYKAKLPPGIMETPMFEKYLDAFPFISTNDAAIDIFEVYGSMKPFVSLNNSGWLVFPISGTGAILNTYSYINPNKDENGRPTTDLHTLSNEEIAVIEETLIDSLPITRPIAVDGSTTFSIRNAAEPRPTIMILKIDRSWNWTTTYNFLRKML